jgi:Flp pilus assembly protein TadB
MSGPWWVLAILASAAATWLAVPPRATRLPPGAAGTPAPPLAPVSTPIVVPRSPARPSESRRLRHRAAVASAASGVGVAVFVGAPAGPPLGLVVAVLTWRTTSRMTPPSQRRRAEALARSLPHAVDLLAVSLEAGASPERSVRLVAGAVARPLDEELRLVANDLVWRSPVTVWEDLGTHPQLGPLGRALARAAESGASVVGAMRELAEDLDRDQQAAAESRARAVGVRAALPLGVCLLPAFVLLGIVPLVAGVVGPLLGR